MVVSLIRVFTSFYRFTSEENRVSHFVSSQVKGIVREKSAICFAQPPLVELNGREARQVVEIRRDDTKMDREDSRALLCLLFSPSIFTPRKSKIR